MASTDIIVVIPVYNEQHCVGTVVDEWLFELRGSGIKFQMLLLDDGSTDQTLEVLRSQADLNGEIEVISKSNSGHGQTCIFGYELALARGAQSILQIDSDGQCDPKYFMQFWQSRKPGFSIQGFRRTREDGLQRLLGSRLLSVAVLLMTGRYVLDLNVPYRLMDGESLAVALARVSSTKIELANVALSYIYDKNFSIEWVPINFRKRAHPRPAMGAIKTVSMAITFVLQFKHRF